MMLLHFLRPGFARNTMGWFSLLTMPVIACAQDAAWIQRQVPGPPARGSHGLVYDTARHVAILFGGAAVSGPTPPVLGDTWEWNGTLWTARQVSGPSRRAGHAMCYDADRRVTVLFGGFTGTTLADVVTNGETWEWDGDIWRQRLVAGPSPRCRHAMAYDTTRHVTVLFGGQASVSGGEMNAETWEWDGTHWAQRAVAGPSPRAGHAMVYDSDPTRGAVVLFGGKGTSSIPGLEYLNDTWEWNGTAWGQRAVPGPSPRNRHAMAYDTNRGVSVLFGGETYTGVYYGDTWEWDGTAWSQQASGGPTPRSSKLAYDTDHQATLLLGGQVAEDEVSDDTWEWRGPPAPDWRVTILTPLGSTNAYALAASGAQQFGYAYVHCGDAVKQVGGLWDQTAASWTPLGPLCSYASVVYAGSAGQQVGSILATPEFSVASYLHAALWTGTQNSFLDLNPGVESEAYGIGGGQQVGWTNPTGYGNNFHASLWRDTAASWVDLHPTEAAWSVAYGANDEEQVGYAFFAPGGYHASLWRGSAASRVDLGPAGGSTDSVAFATMHGVQVGYAGGHAALWHGTAASWVDLNPAGAIRSSCSATNGSQHVGGATFLSGDVEYTHAGLWGGTAESWVDLSVFLQNGDGYSYATGVATDSVNTYVTGYSLDVFNQGTAILWTHRNVVRTCRLDYNGDTILNPDDIGDFISDYFTVPPVPGPGAYAIPCPGLAPPYNAGYRAAYTSDGYGQCGTPFPDNLGDWITDYFLGC